MHLATRIIHVVTGGGAGTPLRVATHGTGAPVVFLHGLFGLNEHWLGALRHFGHQIRCELVEIPLLDLPGDDCSICGATALIVRFLDGVIGVPAVLLGNSFGGHVALRVALERPDLVSGLVLAGASGISENNGIHDFTTRPTRAWIRTRLAELFHDPVHIRDDEIERLHDAVNQRPTPAHCFACRGRSAKTISVRAWAASVRRRSSCGAGRTASRRLRSPDSSQRCCPAPASHGWTTADTPP